MPIKPVRLITNNFGLKLLALLISIAIWMIVVNVDDPKITRNFTASVTIENASYLTDQGKWYAVPEDGKTVTFSVSGKRSYLEKMSGSDFKAVADLQNIDDENKVPIDITVQTYSSYVSVNSKSRYLTLTVEDLVSKPFVVTVQTTGEVAEGYALGETSVSPSILRVTGPESAVESISKVVATVDVSDISSDMSDSVVPVLYDENDAVVDTTNLTLNVSNILVGVTILNTKEVDLKVSVSAEPDDGYFISDIAYTPQTLTVKGEAKTLKKVSEIAVTVEDDDVELAGATGTVTAYLDITNDLPDGIALVNSEDANITVDISLEELVTVTVAVPTDNITVENLGASYNADFTSAEVEVKFTGAQEDIDNIVAEDIKGIADASGLTVGTHDVDVYFEYDDEIYTVDEPAEAELKVTLNK
ncbi:MAG: hypothetical protein K6E13_07840 [Lachnospiraceae bacterium]|nr:hypothetical protein [Lachnospiraceae bacterium]